MAASGVPRLIGTSSEFWREVVTLLAPCVAVFAVLAVGDWLTWPGAALGAGAAAITALALAQARTRQFWLVEGWLHRGLSESRPSLWLEPLPKGFWTALTGAIRGREDLVRQVNSLDRVQTTLIAALPDPIVIVDNIGIVRRTNEAAERGFDQPVANGTPFTRIIRDPGLLGAVSDAIEHGNASQVVFTPLTDRRKRFLARIEPVELGDGNRGALVALREQTEQVMIERMRSDFIANASHEIRTPLTALQGFIETLRGPARNDPVARDAFLETMAAEAARMRRLVDDLLSLSRLETSVHQAPTELVAMEDVLAAVMRAMKPVAERARTPIDASLGAGLPNVRGDRDLLQQLFVNLVENAIKYGRKQPVLIELDVLEAAPANAGPLTRRPAVRVTVIDGGEGIKAEDLPRITERFYRVDKARSRKVGGTGLGLAIAKHIVRRHHGHLTVESEHGKGSRFTVLLPPA